MVAGEGGDAWSQGSTRGAEPKSRRLLEVKDLNPDEVCWMGVWLWFGVCGEQKVAVSGREVEEWSWVNQHSFLSFIDYPYFNGNDGLFVPCHLSKFLYS